MKHHVFTVHLDKRCTQCKKPGAMESGICLECMLKNLKAGKYDHIFGKYDYILKRKKD